MLSILNAVLYLLLQLEALALLLGSFALFVALAALMQVTRDARRGGAALRCLASEGQIAPAE